MYQASVGSIWSSDIERVEEFPDGAATCVFHEDEEIRLYMATS
jgi:hypothetical protein